VNGDVELVTAAVTAAAAGAVPRKGGGSLALSGAREGRSHERRQNSAL
jgi:hypothetical protein